MNERGSEAVKEGEQIRKGITELTDVIHGPAKSMQKDSVLLSCGRGIRRGFFC